MDLNKNPSYIILTPCFNEEKLITYPIESVIAQTIKPLKWIIIDDGSTDSTAKIIKNYSKKYKWIEYLHINKLSNQTYYGSNVNAITTGYRHIKQINFSYLAILDADIELCKDYYEKIFSNFNKYKKLGIATGTYIEIEGDNWIVAKISRHSTPKAIQVFKKECYEKCGGYLPFKHGGEDSGMEILARMNGWGTWSFDDIIVKHHRPVGTGDGRSLTMARYRLGITDYCLGSHPLFMFAKCLKRMMWERPYFLSGLMRLTGYFVGLLRNLEQPLPPEAISYSRKEQLRRLFKIENNTWRPE